MCVKMLSVNLVLGLIVLSSGAVIHQVPADTGELIRRIRETGTVTVLPITLDEQPIESLDDNNSSLVAVAGSSRKRHADADVSLSSFPECQVLVELIKLVTCAETSLTNLASQNCSDLGTSQNEKEATEKNLKQAKVEVNQVAAAFAALLQPDSAEELETVITSVSTPSTSISDTVKKLCNLIGVLIESDQGMLDPKDESAKKIKAFQTEVNAISPATFQPLDCLANPKGISITRTAKLFRLLCDLGNFIVKIPPFLIDLATVVRDVVAVIDEDPCPSTTTARPGPTASTTTTTQKPTASTTRRPTPPAPTDNPDISTTPRPTPPSPTHNPYVPTTPRPTPPSPTDVPPLPTTARPTPPSPTHNPYVPTTPRPTPPSPTHNPYVPTTARPTPPSPTHNPYVPTTPRPTPPTSTQNPFGPTTASPDSTTCNPYDGYDDPSRNNCSEKVEECPSCVSRLEKIGQALDDIIREAEEARELNDRLIEEARETDGRCVRSGGAQQMVPQCRGGSGLPEENRKLEGAQPIAEIPQADRFSAAYNGYDDLEQAHEPITL